MIREIYHFFRYGPRIQKLQKELGLAAFLRVTAKELDVEGYAEMRRELIGDVKGDVLEIGTGTGATFPYYGPEARVTAIEPNDELRVVAEESSKGVDAQIRVLSGAGERLPFEDSTFDVVSASLVLCSVTSQKETLKEFKRVLRPRGEIRLMEHVRSEHVLAGPLLDLLNPIWLRVNKMGCNWNRKTVESVKEAGFKLNSVEPYKVYAKSAPAVFPIRLIKGELSA